MSCYICSFLTNFIVASFTIFVGFYFYIKFYHYNYWSRKNVNQLSIQTFPFGNFTELIFGHENFSIQLKKLQDKLKNPFGGVYLGLRPILMIKDSELLKKILIKDFHYFTDRGFYANEKIEPLTNNLLASRGDKWKFLRTKLSPLFSTNKLQEMDITFNKINKRLEEYLLKNLDNSIDMRDMMARYTTDIITSVAYGLDIDSINDSNTEIRKMGLRIIEPKRNELLRFFLGFMIPDIMKKFNLRTTVKELENYFKNLTKDIFEKRENENIIKQDFIEYLMHLKKGGNFDKNGVWDPCLEHDKFKKFTLDELMAQVFVFFIGGFDTGSSAISFGLYELAKNKEIQKKLQNEIDETLKKFHTTEFNYEILKEMKYLDCIVDETLRMYPSVPFLFRNCLHDYKIPDTDVIIDEGTLLAISILSIHYDPENYPNPTEFNPDNFTQEAKNLRKPCTYLPFGEGPRTCIGIRLGHLQTKMGIAAVLSKFDVQMPDNESYDIKYNPNYVGIANVGGIKLKLTSRTK